jgi:hypothetical protein
MFLVWGGGVQIYEMRGFYTIRRIKWAIVGVGNFSWMLLENCMSHLAIVNLQHN